MLSNRLIVGVFGVSLASILLAPDLGASTGMRTALASASAPCEPTFDPPSSRPKTPTGLRIIPPDSGDQSGPYADFESAVPLSIEAAGSGAHDYFDLLSNRPDCLVAYHLRSQDQLDNLETAKSGVSEKGESRFPIIYDAAVDAALVRINPGVGSTDGENKKALIRVSDGSMLLTWDLRFDNGHKFLGEGYLHRHKTFQIGWFGESGSGNNRWLVFKTDYVEAAKAGKGVAELFLSTQNAQWHGPGTFSTDREILRPRLGDFFMAPNTWTRVWFWLQDVGQSVSYVSVWMADETRDPVQMYDRIAVITPPGGIEKFWLEYDTSQEDALNGEMRSWNRNLVILKNVPVADVKGLLQRPRP